MKHLTTYLILLLGIASSTLACGNEYGHSLDGERIFTRYFYLSERMLAHDTASTVSRLREHRLKIARGDEGFKTKSNIALYLMKLGKVDSALLYLQPLVRQYPEEYALAANYGTAFELAGKLDSALFYIRKGRSLNPDSHLGSEWIHERILEAKIKQRTTPDWISTHLLLTPAEIKNGVQGKSPSKLIRQLDLQIKTRAPFTPAPNPVIVNLMTCLGEVYETHETYENALLAYAYAIKFEPKNARHKRLRDRIISLNERRASQASLNELPESMIRLVKQGRVDPELFVMGLDDVAEDLDSMDYSMIRLQDSLQLARQDLDSLEVQQQVMTQFHEEQMAAFHRRMWLYLALCMVGGITGGMLLYRLFRRK